MQKAYSIPSAGTAADSGQKVENISVSQHSSKPLVVGSQSQTPHKESVRPQFVAATEEESKTMFAQLNNRSATEERYNRMLSSMKHHWLWSSVSFKPVN